MLVVMTVAVLLVVMIMAEKYSLGHGDDDDGGSRRWHTRDGNVGWVEGYRKISKDGDGG